MEGRDKVKRGDAEFLEMQDCFERGFSGTRSPIYMGFALNPRARAKRKEDLTWPPYFYENGEADRLFRVYMAGYALGKATFQLEGAQP